MEKTGKKCHVQLPNSILDKFVDGKNVWRMDEHGNIDSLSPRDCNIVESYYSEDVETKLLGEIESRFGMVKKKIIDRCKYSDSFTFTEDDLKYIKKFYYLTIARNPETAKNIVVGSYLRELYDISDQDFSIMATDKALEDGVIDEGDYAFSIVTNETDIGFVLCQNWVSTYKKINDSRFMYIMPINNKMGIIHQPKDLYQYDNDGRQLAPLVDSVECMDFLNLMAIKEEFASDKDSSLKYVYANSKELLERYVGQIGGKHEI